MGEQSMGHFVAQSTVLRAGTESIHARLRALQAVTDPALSQVGVATLSNEICSRVSDALLADAAALHLLNDAGEYLLLELLHGAKRGLHARREIAVGDGVIGGVAATGRAAVMESLVAVPLRCLGRVRGVLTVAATTHRDFDEDDVRLASIAADRLACAIERSRLYDAEQRARASAENALTARDDFLSMASHELKTPMTSLILLVQCLLKSEARPPTGTELVRKLESIERQVMRLAQITEYLLDVSRIHAPAIGLELATVDLGEVARAAIDHATEKFQHSKSPVSLHVGVPAVGRWDRARCEQMVTHLLSNAANYGEQRPIEVDVTADENTARLTVRDRGSGIPLQHQQRIFDRYTRAPDAKNIAGLGMGLWVVRRIAAAMGGSVFVESAPGEGSAFTVELPLSGPTERGVTTSSATTV